MRWGWRRTALGVATVSALCAVILAWMGRGLWCRCASPVPWSWVVMSEHNSQHLIDPYSLSHVLHGLVFYGLFSVVFGERYTQPKLVAAAALEAIWEVVENTDRVIQHYRESTISLDYYGDSIANSMADIGFCVLGAVIASVAPVAVSAVGFVVTELLLLAWIRDSLLLNVLMLTWPIEAVKRWQTGE